MMPADQLFLRILTGAVLCCTLPVSAQEVQTPDDAFLEFLALEAESETRATTDEPDNNPDEDALALASWLAWWDAPTVEEEKDHD